MANPKIQVDITADASKLKKGASEAEKAIKDIDDAADKLGKGKGTAGLGALGDAATDVARNKLGPLGDVAEGLGGDLDKMSGKTLAAGAAIVGLGGFIAGGVQKLGEMTDEVRKFNDTSGVGWESSSRLVSVMDDLGISADTGASAMGRLAKNIDAGKLGDFGIEAVRAKDGSVDLAATLGVVADRMNATTDPTKKAAMGTALFGKSWADLQPLLQQGSKGITDAMGSVKDYQIVTAESAQEQREMAMAVDDMQDAFAGLQMNLAKGLVPALTRTAAGISEILNLANKGSGKKGLFDGLFSADLLAEQKRLNEISEAGSEYSVVLDGLATSMAAAGAASTKTGIEAQALADAELAASDAAEELAEKQRSTAVALKDLEDRAKAQRAELDLLNGVVLSVAGSTLAYENAQLSTSKAAKELTEKQQAVTDAVNQFGSDSPEVTKATDDYTTALQSAKSAALGQADAAVEQAEKLALAAGETFTAEQRNIVYKDSLMAVRDAATDEGLRSGLDGYIALTQTAQETAHGAAAGADALASAMARVAAESVGAQAALAVAQTFGGQSGGGALTNQRLGNVTLEIDKKVLGTVMLPTLRDLERQRR